MCSAKVDVLEVNELTDDEKGEIDSFLKSSPYSNIFQTIGWGKVLYDAVRFAPHIITVRDGVKICGTLLFSEDVETRRFIAEDGPVLTRDDYELFRCIYYKYLEFCHAGNARRIEIHLPPDYSFAKYFQLYSWRGIKEIKDPIEVIYRGLDRRSTRYSIRRAIRKNVTIVEAKNEEDYLHHIRLARASKIRGRCSTRLNPLIKNDYRILRATIRHCRENCKIFLANVGKECIATVQWLFFGEKAYYYDVGLNYLYKEYSAPDYLMWYSIKYLKKLGISRLDLMGVVSPLGSEFKRKWSNRLVSNRYLIWTRPDFYPAYLLAYPDSIIDVKHFIRSVFGHLTVRTR